MDMIDDIYIFFNILDFLILIDPNFYNLINLSLCNKFIKTVVQNYIKTDIIFLKWNNSDSKFKRKYEKLWYVFNLNQKIIPHIILPITNYGNAKQSNYEFRIPKNSNLKNKTLNHTLIINPKKDDFKNIYKSTTLSYKSTFYGSNSIIYDPTLFLKYNYKKNKTYNYFTHWIVSYNLILTLVDETKLFDTKLFYNNNNFVFFLEIGNWVLPIKIIAKKNPIIRTVPILDDTIHKKRKRSDLECQILGVVIQKENIKKSIQFTPYPAINSKQLYFGYVQEKLKIPEDWHGWEECKLDKRYNNIMPLVKCTLCETSQLCNMKCLHCNAKFIY